MFVSHGLPATAFLCDEITVMHRGTVVERGPSADIVRAAEHLHTRGLLAAHPRRVVARAARRAAGSTPAAHAETIIASAPGSRR
ncbi:hypothetical protein [Pseudonocardia sp. NPDC046786]|uniref:hypothetical protein n=1 Tax=Pseudonocardia sp. NPDC046786 TaxID=3155471 RepID=UPI0033F6D1AB